MWNSGTLGQKNAGRSENPFLLPFQSSRVPHYPLALPVPDFPDFHIQNPHDDARYLNVEVKNGILNVELRNAGTEKCGPIEKSIPAPVPEFHIIHWLYPFLIFLTSTFKILVAIRDI